MARVTTSCNNCGLRKTEVVLKDLGSEKFTLVSCRNCGLKYINPRPDKNSIKKYYKEDSYWSGNLNAYKTYRYIYKFVLSSVKKGSVLDIGAGTGLFLSHFKNIGWKAYGIEPSKAAVLFAKKKFGISIKQGYLESLNPRETYDLVTLNNVIEHFHDPKKELKIINHILKNDGVLMISCPNFSSFGAKIFTDKWYGIDAPRHLYQFEPSTLEEILESSGFKIVRWGFGFFSHDRDILFESFRNKFSRKSAASGNDGEPKSKESGSVISVKPLMIVVCKILSAIIATVEPVFCKSEIMTVLAIKNK